MSVSVSVIVPCFNHARFLNDSLGSVLRQTMDDWEVIVVDDGSSDDDTAVVMEEWRRRDSRFKLVSKKNGGLSSARNVGLLHADGRYVQFLDADDAILPQKLQRQVDDLKSVDGLAFSYSDYCFGDNGELTTTSPRTGRVEIFEENAFLDVLRNWENELSIPIHCYLFDRRFFTEHRLQFDERLPNHEDWDFILAALELRPAIRFIDDVFAIYRTGSMSMSKNWVSMRSGFLAVVEKRRQRSAADSALLAELDRKEWNGKSFYRRCIGDQPTADVLVSRLESWVPAAVKQPMRQVQRTLIARTKWRWLERW